MIPKVLAYITRQRANASEVLVFRHIAYPEAGLQVPGGTVDGQESLEAALLREIEEETGLRGLRLLGQVASAPFYAHWRDEWQQRNIFQLTSPKSLPENWIHTVSAGAEDAGLEFEYFWMPIDEASERLMWGQGRWLANLLSETGNESVFYPSD